MARSMMLELKTKDKSGEKRFSVDDIKKLHFLYKTVIDLPPENNGCLILKKNVKGYFLEVKIDGGNIHKDVHLGPLKGSSIVSLRDKIRDAIDKNKIVLRPVNHNIQEKNTVNISSKSLDDFNKPSNKTDRKETRSEDIQNGTAEEITARFTRGEKEIYEKFLNWPKSFPGSMKYIVFRKQIQVEPEYANIKRALDADKKYIEELQEKFDQRSFKENFLNLFSISRDNTNNPEIYVRPSLIKTEQKPPLEDIILYGTKPYLKVYIPCPSCGKMNKDFKDFPGKEVKEVKLDETRIGCLCGQKLKYGIYLGPKKSL